MTQIIITEVLTEEKKIYNYKATVLEIYDADTITVDIQLGFNIVLREKIRLYGINAPEIKTKNAKEKKLGIEARDFLRGLILNKEVCLKTYKVEKFGRYLADIFLDDGIIVNALLVEKGYAKPYFGERRTGWDG